MLIYKKNMKLMLVLLLFISLSKISYSNIGKVTGLEIPRYVSLKSNDANIRVGPSKNYPIVIKYVNKNFPLKVIEEYGEWRKIEDHINNIGWVHKSLISGDRSGVIISNDNESISILNTVGGKIIGKIGRGNIVSLNKCKIDWCFVLFNNHKGWISKNNLWGVEEKEIFKISFYQNVEDIYWWSINTIDSLQKDFKTWLGR